jgi:DNA-binding NarL/FixJ family response regulator
MDASVAVEPAPVRLDTLVLGVAASNQVLRERVAAVAAMAGVEVRMTARDADALLADGHAEELTAIVVCSEPGDAAALVERLRERLSAAALVLVTDAEGARAGLRRLRDCGADGIVPESRLEAALPATLAAVQNGQIVMPRELIRTAQPALSFREKQILALVVMGFTNAGIANKLFLAESTVKSHLSSAFTKLGVRSRHEAAALLADPEHRGLGVLTIARD